MYMIVLSVYKIIQVKTFILIEVQSVEVTIAEQNASYMNTTIQSDSYYVLQQRLHVHMHGAGLSNER